MNARLSHAERVFGLPPGSFPFDSRFVEIDGARLHYVDEGDGPVLLLLHGNPTWSFVYRDIIARLRGSFRCVAMDYPGFGLSTVPTGFSFAPAAQAALVEAFVDRLGLQQITPVMQDWGGPIGLWLAGRRPQNIARLVIGNTWAWPVNGDLHFEWFSRLLGGPIGRWGVRRHNAFVNLLIPAGIRRSKVSPTVMQAYRAPLPTPDRRMPSYVFPRSILTARDFLADVETGLAGLRDKPTLILWGDKDIAFRSKERQRFAALFRHHRVKILAGAGHYIQEDAAEEIAAAIADWWR